MIIKTSYIYILIDPITLLIRYVGQTIQKPTTRWKDHLDEKSETHKCHWIQSLLRNDHQPFLEVIEVLPNISKEQLNAWEIFYICRLKKLGHPLTNMTLGGDGTWGYKHTEESLRKQRLAAQGRRPTVQCIEAAREVCKGKPQSEVAKQKNRNSNIGRKQSNETCERKSITLKGRKPAPQTIEASRLAHIGKAPWNADKTGCYSEESLTKMRVAALFCWQKRKFK